MQVNSVVCRCDGIIFKAESSPFLKKSYNYRGNRVYIGLKSITVFVIRKNIRDIFFDIHFAEDLSQALSKFLKQEIKVVPRISNLHGSKALNFKRSGQELKKFVQKIDEICGVQEIRVCEEASVFFSIPFTWDDSLWEANYMGISIRANKGKLTCKFQMNKDKTKYLATFIVSHFDQKVEKFNQLLVEDNRPVE